MRFIYDKTEDMWVFEDLVANDIKISIVVTRWAEAGKGPMLDFAIKADDMAEHDVYEVEILTGWHKENYVKDYCKLIRDCYNLEDFLKNITERGSDIFNSHANGYFRKIEQNGKVMQYVKRRWSIRLKFTSQYENYNGLKLKGNEKPALEYPGSRIDCICD